MNMDDDIYYDNDVDNDHNDDISTNYFYEDYFGDTADEINFGHMDNHFERIENDLNLFESCINPTAYDAVVQFLLPIVIANVANRCLTRLILFYVRSSCWSNANSSSIRVLLFWIVSKLDQFVTVAIGFGLLGYHFRHDHWGLFIFVFFAFLFASILIPLLITLSFWPVSSSKPSILKNPTTSSVGVIFLWLFSFVLISLNEAIIWYSDIFFTKLRPNIMLIVMKSVSYYCETKIPKNSHSKFTLVSHFGRLYLDFLSYLVHPCSLILGVWHPHQSAMVHFHAHRSPGEVAFSKFKWLNNNLFRSALSMLLSILFLLTSTCFIEHYINQTFYNYLFDLLEFVIPPSILNPLFMLLQAYSTAVQFHFSHYFICFAAQSMFDLWAIRLTITKPLLIEFPRSLVDVVVAWNIPMHQWLKKYVFQPFKRRFKNIYLTIFATYLISSYLHGFNFQIWSVLLTLGVLTQAEFKLRQRLSHIFSSCIGSRVCVYMDYDPPVSDSPDRADHSQRTQVCVSGNHSHTSLSCFSIVRVVNLMFTFFALLNLAFLGSTFDGKLDSSSFENVWHIWSLLHFYSHILAAIMFVLYKLI